jgi:hypothetical protein
MVVKCIAIVFNVSAKEFVLAQLPRNLRSVTNQAVKVIDIKTPHKNSLFIKSHKTQAIL